MKLNPLDIRRQQFAKKTFGGYDPAEVDGFVKQIADQWEDVLDENRAVADRAQEFENKLRHYERVEMALQEALETARESGRRSEAMAEQKAKLIVEEAEMRARQIVQDAERDRYGMRQDLAKLSSRQTEIGARLRGFLLSELEILAQFQGDDPVGFIKLQPAWPDGAPQGAIGPASEAARLGPAPEPPAPADTWPPEAPAAGPFRFDEPEPATPEPEPAPAAPEPAAPTAVPFSPGASEPAPDVFPPLGASAAPPPAPMPALDHEPRPPAAPMWAPDPPPPAREPAAPPPATPSWNLRSLVTGEGDNVAGSEAERDRIRRILDDLD